MVALPLVLITALFLLETAADIAQDKQALLDFSNALPHSRRLNWNERSPVCGNWTGVTCSSDEARVVALRLPAVGFIGRISLNTLSRLTSLRTLSLRSNRLNGGFPSDFDNLKSLSFLYLQNNDFSGVLPADFSAWPNLVAVNLCNNRFSGEIPFSLLNLPQLSVLNLANNSLSGRIPDIQVSNLRYLNLSNNKLIGSVPQSLRKFGSSFFAGNNLSFDSSPPGTMQNGKSETGLRLGDMAVLGIVVSGCVIGLVLLLSLMFFCCSRKKGEGPFSDLFKKDEVSPEKVVSSSNEANNRLVFFAGCNYSFDLEDLLRASAEVLGKGTFGISYKAILEDATMVVAKRLKDVSAGKRDFEQLMEMVANIRHENVVELKAYFHSKDEKLIVYDYYRQGSLSTILHGNRGEERIHLDWEMRMRVAVGAARGIARVHEENNGRLVHGNVKSSNIFLNSDMLGCVSDVALATIMCPVAQPICRATGYRAPEITDTRRATQSGDVYSFGVVLLELLTGKSPVYSLAGDEFTHLVRWVQSVVREEWTAEVFDLELMRYPNIDEELVEMLQVAMSCVLLVPDQRPNILQVVKMIESIRHFDSPNSPSSELTSLDPPP